MVAKFLADPSYSGQLLTLTYPMIGNYGVPSEAEVDQYGVSVHFESSKIHVGALIIDDLSGNYRLVLHVPLLCSSRVATSLRLSHSLTG